MKSSIYPGLTRERVAAVTRFLPVFAQRGFRPGDWVAIPGQMPYFSYNRTVYDFLAAVEASGLLLEADWRPWVDEARACMAEPGRLQTANLLTLRRLLTVHIRSERFNDGHLALVFQHGQMVAILQRLQALYPEEPR